MTSKQGNKGAKKRNTSAVDSIAHWCCWEGFVVLKVVVVVLVDVCFEAWFDVERHGL